MWENQTQLSLVCLCLLQKVELLHLLSADIPSGHRGAEQERSRWAGLEGGCTVGTHPRPGVGPSGCQAGAHLHQAVLMLLAVGIALAPQKHICVLQQLRTPQSRPAFF